MLRFKVAGRAHYGLANNYYRTKSASHGVIDYHYMEVLISSVQKLVIKDVVLYAKEK